MSKRKPVPLSPMENIDRLLVPDMHTKKPTADDRLASVAPPPAPKAKKLERRTKKATATPKPKAQLSGNIARRVFDCPAETADEIILATMKAKQILRKHHDYQLAVPEGSFLHACVLAGMAELTAKGENSAVIAMLQDVLAQRRKND